MKPLTHWPVAQVLALLALLLVHRAPVAHTVGSEQRNVQFANLTTEDGLSSEFVQDLIQDRLGYIWFATQAGLNRFDGHDIRVYEHRAEDPRSLSHNFVLSLYVDHDGVLWIGTNRGVNTYDPATDSFDRQPLGDSLSFVRVRKITQDSRGRFWVGSVASGLIGVDAGSGEVVKYTHDPERADSLPDDQVIDIHEDSNNELWVGTDGGGVARFNSTTETFEVFRNEPANPNSLSDNEVRSIYSDGSGNLWIGTARGGLNRLDRATGRFKRYQHDPGNPNSLGSGQVASVYEDANGTLWIGTEGGLSEWRPAIDGFVNYTRNPADRKSLINNLVNKIVQDASGVLWLATHGGVSAWNYISDTFQHYDSANHVLQSDVVTSIAETSDGLIWVGTYGGGLSRLDLETGAAHHYRHDPDDETSLADDRVMTVHVDGDDTVWVGTRNAGLERLEDDGSFTHFRSDANNAHTLSGNAVTRIFSERDGTLWVGVFGGGLNRLRWQDTEPVFERFRHDPEDDTSLSGDRVLAIHQDSDGVLWVGTESAGLNRFNAHSNSFERFDVEEYYDSDNSNPVSGTPWEIHESSDGTMWLGTLGLGLLRWSAADRRAGVARFEQFASADGLASEVYGIVEGSMGELWLSSSRGLFQFDPAQGTVRKFDRSNALRNNEFNHGARLRTRSGRVMFGGTDGLLGFYPQELPRNDRPPAIDLLASSRTATLARAGSGQMPTIELAYLDPFVSFEFVALDFMSPDKNEYRYRLTGYDAEWNDARGYRRAIYSSLLPGEYTFEVQAANSDGVWNRNGPAMQLTVIPPPWQTWWAYLAYALAGASLILLYLRKQQQKRRQEAEIRTRLEELVTQRTTQLAERNEELTLLNRRFKEASVTDLLTGLRNRRFVDQFIATEVSTVQRRLIESSKARGAECQRKSSKILFFLMIDLDGFKQINDTFGHHAGDNALLEVKNRLVTCCRASDVVIRWGGDEFLIVGHTADFAGARILAEKIRKALAKPAYDVCPGQTARLSGSMGIAAIPFVEGKANFGTWEQIVAIADHGAYLSKSNGRNAWVAIRGTESMEEQDFVGVKQNLQNLVEKGKLVIDSSAPGGVSLRADALLHRVAVDAETSPA